MELQPLMRYTFTICLKFQLTNISALAIVAVAMCKQSSKLVFPTTFSSMYFVARLIISSLILIFSLDSSGMFL